MQKPSTNKKPALFIGIAISAITVLLILFGDLKNPKDVSNNRLNELKRAVISFVETNGRAPVDLSELGLPEDKLQDHLGEPFIYTVNDHSIRLLSYGSDKKPGGNFFKGDYSVTIELPEQKSKQ